MTSGASPDTYIYYSIVSELYIIYILIVYVYKMIVYICKCIYMSISTVRSRAHVCGVRDGVQSDVVNRGLYHMYIYVNVYVYIYIRCIYVYVSLREFSSHLLVYMYIYRCIYILLCYVDLHLGR